MSGDKEIQENEQNTHLSYRDRILVYLSTGDLHFKPLMEKVGCSRGVLATHLRKLREEELVAYGEHDAKYNNNCPHCLTSLGREEAESISYSNAFRELSPEIRNQFVISYKLMVVNNLQSLASKPPYKSVVRDPKTRKSKIDTNGKLVTRLVGGPFEIPCNGELSSSDIESLSKVPRYRRENEEKGRRIINAIQKLLKSYGFSENEIIKMWLADKGSCIAQILRFWTNHLSQEPTKEEVDSMKARIRQDMRMPHLRVD